MKYQTDPAFNAIIQHFGCYFFALASKVEKRTRPDRPFSADELNAIYRAALQTGIIGPEKWGDGGEPLDGCFILDPNALLSLLGARATVRTRDDGAGGQTASFPPSWPDLGAAEIIQRWEKQNPTFSHFVAGVDRDRVEFDSIRYANGAGSNTVRDGAVVSLRLVDFL